jgi:conjugative transposon TraM protein
MEQVTKSQRQKQFLLVLPVLVLPFMTFLLWSIGLLGGTSAKAQDTTAQQGLNMRLPGAKLKEDKHANKLTFYEQADMDSAKYKEALKNDPFFGLKAMDTSRHVGARTSGYPKIDYDPSPLSGSNYRDANEEKVTKKLAELDEALNKSAEASQAKQAGYQQPAKEQPQPYHNEAIERLENMVQAMNQKDTGSGSEMQQLNTVMDKILQAQHPEMVREKLQQQSEKHKQEVFPVVLNSETDNVSALQAKDTVTALPQPNAFYSLEDNPSPAEAQNTIQAVVQETQTLVSGSTVKLRIVNDVYINGMLVPKDNFVFGIASLNGERLHIAISSIRYGENILPVSLAVYDLDGMPGVFIPGAISRDVAKQSADASIQGLGLTTLDPSLSAQAASAGIEAAKSLISKKVKLVKVTVKAGYQVLLKGNPQNP